MDCCVYSALPFESLFVFPRARRDDDGKTGSVSRRLLSTLLNEMDGVEKNVDVYIIGASNRVGDIDDALLRPGTCGRSDSAAVVSHCACA